MALAARRPQARTWRACLEGPLLASRFSGSIGSARGNGSSLLAVSALGRAAAAQSAGESRWDCTFSHSFSVVYNFACRAASEKSWLRAELPLSLPAILCTKPVNGRNQHFVKLGVKCGHEPVSIKHRTSL